MANKKNKYLAAQIATQGPTKGQQRISRRVQQYDELMRKQQPLTKKDASRVRKSPPTKRERKITRACQLQAKMIRKEIRQTNRDNIAALLDATKSSRSEGATLMETETDYLFQFCGNLITNQSEDESIHAAAQASAAPFHPRLRVLFTSGTCGKIKGSKQPGTITTVPRNRSAGAAVVCKSPSGSNHENINADDIWEEKLFGLSLPPSNSTQQSIEVGLRSVTEALALVATQLACTRDDGGPQNDEMCIQPRVTIFTDSQSVMSKIRNIGLTAQQLKSTPCVEKLITISEYLRHIGVEVELRWSPRLKSEGSKRAESASRRATTSQVAYTSGESLDEDLEILINSLEQECS